jgi:hypothetical protein
LALGKGLLHVVDAMVGVREASTSFAAAYVLSTFDLLDVAPPGNFL